MASPKYMAYGGRGYNTKERFYNAGEGLRVKQGFTPGPWTITQEESVLEAKQVVSVQDGRPIAEILESDQPKTVWANAALIAATPELLEACKAYADKYFSRAKGDLERLTPEARQILNAIAKAEQRA